MGKWRESLAVHIILPLLLAVAIGFSTVAGMIIEGTKEYANEGGQKQEDFYVSQKQILVKLKLLPGRNTRLTSLTP